MANEDLLQQIDDACVDMPGVASTDCPMCERVGLPILPVRLSVCERTAKTAGFTELPADRVTAFTDIRLDQTVSEQGKNPRTLGKPVRQYMSKATSNQVSKYLLRQLRPGYFYLLDDENTRNQSSGGNSKGGDRSDYNWYGYVVTTDGMFYQYAVGESPPSPEQPEFTCGLNEDERRYKTVSASVIALDSVDTATNIYYLYTDHPLSTAFLHHLRTGRHSDGRDMRDVAMQSFDVAAWRDGKEQPYAFSSDDLPLVAEYSDNAAGMEDFFWPDTSRRKLFTREELRHAMAHRLRAASRQLKDKSLILGVHDEVGLIYELNAYRKRPLELLEEFLQQHDPQGYLNRRNLLCYKAIEIFEENYRIQRKQAQAPMNRRVEATSQPGIDDKQQRIDQLNREMDAIRADGDVGWLDRGRIETLRIERDDLQRQIDAERQSTELMTEEPLALLKAYNKELADCYTSPDAPVDEATGKRINPELEDFKTRYLARIELVNQLVRAFDEDYVQWVETHLDRVTLRYDDGAYPPGLGLSGLLANALSGGIMSDASKRLWETLARDIDSPQSLLLKTLFSNQRRLIDDAITVRQGLPPKVYVPPRTLLRWREQYRALLKDEREFRYDTTMAGAITTIGDSLYGLMMQDATKAIIDTAAKANKETDTAEGSSTQRERNGDDDTPPPASTINPTDLPNAAAVESFNRYQQLVITGSHDVQQVEASDDSSDPAQYRLLPVLATVEVGRRDFYNWLDELNRQITPRQANSSPSEALQFHQDNAVGGNFSVTRIENNHSISVVIPINTDDPDFLKRYNTTTDDFNEEDIAKSGWDNRQNARSIGASIADGVGAINHPATVGLSNKSFVASKTFIVYNNISVLIRELNSDNPDAIQVATALGKLALVGIDSVDFASTYLASTNATLGSLSRYLQFAKGPIEAVLATLSISDGINKQSQAQRAAKLGYPESIQNKYRQSGNIDIADGFVSLGLIAAGFSFGGPIGAGVMAAVGIGASISFSLLKITMGSSLNVLLAPAVIIWVTRCRYGHRVDEGQMLPYESMEDEKNGLELVFSGVTVEMVVRHPALEALERHGGGIPSRRMWEIANKNAQNSRERIVEILVTVPDVERMEVGLRLERGEGLTTDALINKNYIKAEASEILQDRGGRGSNEDPDNIKISKSGKTYSITSEKKILTRQPRELLSLYINFLNSDRASEPKTGIFEVRA